MKLSTINIKKGKKVVMPFGIKMIGTAASFAFSILLGRLLGPDGVGVYSVANNLLTISLIIVKFGLDIALIKHISIYFHKKHSGDARRAMHDSALLCLALSSALILFFEVTATLFAKLFNMDGSLDQLLRFMIVAIAPTGLLHLLSSFFKGVRSTKTGLFFESALIPLASCSFLLLAGVLWDELNFWSLGIVYLTSAAVSFVVAAVVYSSKVRKLEYVVSSDYKFKNVLSTAHPLLLVNSTNYILSCADTIMLSMWCLPSDVGVYNVAIKITLLFSMLISVVNALFGPHFAAMYHDGKIKELKGELTKVNRTMRIGSLLLVLALGLLGYPILSLWGQEFTVGLPVLLIALVGQFFVLSKGPLATLLMMCGREKQHRNNTIICAVVNIILNACLIPFFSIYGAAIATSISLVIKNVLTIVTANKMFEKAEKTFKHD